MPSPRANATKSRLDKEDRDMVRPVKGVKSVNIKEDKSESYSANVTTAQQQQNVNIIKKEQFSNTTEGHGCSKTDNELNEKVVTVDKTIAKEVFNNDAIGQTLFIDDQGFKIVGIANDEMNDSAVHMPSQTFSKYMGNLNQ